MGCSASRTITIVANNNKTPEEDPSSSASLSLPFSCASSTSSYSSSFSNSASSQVPKALSFPMPLVHHPPTKKGDTHHLVFLTSTTYGSLLLIDQKDSNFTLNNKTPQIAETEQQQHTSLSPDSVINTWELMDGLDEQEEEELEKQQPPPHHTTTSCRYTTFDGSARKKLLDSFESLKQLASSEDSTKENPCSPASPKANKKPLWQHLSEEALLAKLDPSVAWSYRRALSSRQLGTTTTTTINNDSNKNRGFMSMGSSPMNSSSSSSSSSSFGDHNMCNLAGSEDRIVVYCTSLRGIRKTYEDCCSVKMILRGFRVAVDERDISMDSSYRNELKELLGGKAVSLPQVFIRGKHVGNAEELKKLNETGELARMLSGFPIQDPGFVCENCGEARFVPCPNCSGSRKVFEEKEGGLRRCPHCNENGLIRCPACCS